MPEQNGYYGENGGNGGVSPTQPMQQSYTPQTGAFPYSRRGSPQAGYINGGYYNQQGENSRSNYSAPEPPPNAYFPQAQVFGQRQQGQLQSQRRNISGNSTAFANNGVFANNGGNFQSVGRQNPQQSAFQNNMQSRPAAAPSSRISPHAGNTPQITESAPEPSPAAEEKAKESSPAKSGLLSLLDGIKIDPEKASLILLIVILARNGADITLIMALAYLLM